MNLALQEVDQIRLHVGIHSGYKQIERHPQRGLVGSKRYGGKLKPLPRCEPEIEKAGIVFKYFTSSLLHDLNRMTMMLNLWEEHLHPVPSKELKERIRTMETYISERGGHP